MTDLLISTNWKGDNYNFILVIVEWLTKIVHYKPVKITIHALGLTRVIIDMVVWHHGLPDSIMTNESSFFISKFWSLLCYFLSIKRWLSIIFHPQTNRQTDRQNSIMETYLKAFVNFKQNNWVKLLSMAEFVYNNTKNTSTGHTPFELNCVYHSRLFYKEDIDPSSKFKSINKWLTKL